MSKNSLVGSERHFIVVSVDGAWPKFRRQLQEALRSEISAFHEITSWLDKSTRHWDPIILKRHDSTLKPLLSR